MKRAVFGALICAYSTLLVPLVQAQPKPFVEIIPILNEKRPKLITQKVGLGDCYGLSSAQREELAIIRVLIPGPLERTAEHLAKEKAGEMGANCLYPLYAAGEESVSYPIQRTYRALRVTIPSGPYRVPAAPDSIPSLESADGSYKLQAFAPLKAPKIAESKRHSCHLGWLFGGGVTLHEVGITTSRATPALRRDILKDFDEYFSDVERETWLRTIDAGGSVRVDLLQAKVTALRGNHDRRELGLMQDGEPR
jgi:hypothetical protein